MIEKNKFWLFQSQTYTCTELCLQTLQSRRLPTAVCSLYSG